MSNLIRLGDYITEKSEKTVVNNQYVVLTSSQEGIVSQQEYFNKQVASKDNTGYKIIRRGQFTFRAMSDTGRFYINRLHNHDVGIVSPAYPVFELDDNPYILPDYLQEYFRSEHFQNSIILSSTGSTRVSLKLSKIQELKINVPSIADQRSVVNGLNHVAHLIDAQKKASEKLDQLVKSRFVEMFGDCKNEVLIGDVISISRGASPRPISSFITDKEDGVNWIKIGDVSENSLYITKTDEKITPEGAKKSRMVYKGDFILSNSMSFGRPYILDICGCVHDGWLIMSNFKETFNELYLYYAIRGDDVQYQFSGKVNGATVKNLNSDLVKNTVIKVPPMELQEQFAAFVEQVDKSKLYDEMEVAA